MRRWLSVVVLSVLSVGCAHKNAAVVENAVFDYYSGDYDAAAKKLEPLAKKADEDFVVNNLRLASARLAAYDLDEAEAAFLRAIEVINSTGVNDGGRTLGAVLVDEKVRIWKGEPFERAMASFDLGVLYYIRHDYGNARASFENALFKLRDYDPDVPTTSPEIDSNFAPAILMLAKSFQRIGRDDLATANFELVRQRYPELGQLADAKLNGESNLLLIVDYGTGPRKVTDFDGAIVGFGPRPFEAGPTPVPVVRVDGSVVSTSDVAHPPVDLLALAQQRRWQSIDTLRTVKSAVGTGMLYGAAIEGMRGASGEGARQRTDLMVAGGLLAGGLLLKGTSQADVRQWEMLPRTTFILPLHVAPGKHDVSVQFSDGTRQVWHNLIVPADGEATYYLRMQRWSSGPFEWPPAGMQNQN